MPRIIPCLTLFFICLTATVATAEIYKTVDKNGKITFSDTPPPNTNAKPVELKSINTTPATIPTSNPLPGATTASHNQPNTPYQLRLTAPTNGTTLLPNERSVLVSAAITPNLQNDDIFAFKLDGKVVAKATDASYTMVEPPRGEHFVSVAIVDRDGNELAQSDAATIVVMRPIVKQPPAPVPKK